MPEEHHHAGIHLESTVLDIGGDVGALILLTGESYREAEIEISPLGDDARRTHTAIHERRLGGQTVYAGVYPELLAGEYRLWTDDPALPDRVTIVGGEVTTIDWRRAGSTQRDR